MLAMHDFANVYDGKLGLNDELPGDLHDPVRNMLPTINLAIGMMTAANGAVGPQPPFITGIDAVRGPLDPTYRVPVGKNGRFDVMPTSYCANHYAFVGPPRLVTIRDGTSNTVAMAERYFETKARQPFQFDLCLGGTHFFIPGEDRNQSSFTPDRPATFADAGYLDVVPVTAGSPPVARPSVPGFLFQVRPTIDRADGHQLQTPYASGLLVALFDGSVRTISPAVSEGVFWGSLTPAGGEVANLD